MAGIQNFLQVWFYLHILQTMYLFPIFSISLTLFPPSWFLLPTPRPIVYKPLFLHQCLITSYGLSDTLIFFFAQWMCKVLLLLFYFYPWMNAPMYYYYYFLAKLSATYSRLILLLRSGQGVNEFEVDRNVCIVHSVSDPSLVLYQLPCLVSLNLLLLKQS